jgi:hypothetical protein
LAAWKKIKKCFHAAFNAKAAAKRNFLDTGIFLCFTEKKKNIFSRIIIQALGWYQSGREREQGH